jgi:hypothetical protein
VQAADQLPEARMFHNQYGGSSHAFHAASTSTTAAATTSATHADHSGYAYYAGDGAAAATAGSYAGAGYVEGEGAAPAQSDDMVAYICGTDEQGQPVYAYMDAATAKQYQDYYASNEQYASTGSYGDYGQLPLPDSSAVTSDHTSASTTPAVTAGKGIVGEESSTAVKGNGSNADSEGGNASSSAKRGEFHWRFFALQY